MKKITYLLAFLSITALFTNLEYKDSLTVVETPNIDASYISYETQTENEKNSIFTSFFKHYSSFY